MYNYNYYIHVHNVHVYIWSIGAQVFVHVASPSQWICRSETDPELFYSGVGYSMPLTTNCFEYHWKYHLKRT